MDLWYLPLLVGAGLVGVLLHELTHYLVWWAAGRQPDLDLVQMQTTADIPRVELVDRLAALAPVLFGVPMWMLGLGWGWVTPLSGVALLFYTAGGIWMGGGVGDDIKLAFSPRVE